MTGTKIVVDCATGEETVVPLTAEEQAELDARESVPLPEPVPSAEGRLADLLTALAKVTSVAQIRAAAAKAAEA